MMKTLPMMLTVLTLGLGVFPEFLRPLLAASPTQPPMLSAQSTLVDPSRPPLPESDTAIDEVESEILLPDLEVFPPFDLELEHNQRRAQTDLRLAITFWNSGLGPLELRGFFNPAFRRTQVVQSLYRTDQTIQEHLVGEFIWHRGHDHWHLADFAAYELWSVLPDSTPDQIVASSNKVTFCILETDVIDAERPDFSRRSRYYRCGSELQGLSVGWGDTYDADLDGQVVDISGIPNGVYALMVRVDPANRIQEADEGNNTATVYIELVEGRLAVLKDEDVLTALGLCPRLC
jgi:hypothetical protein